MNWLEWSSTVIGSTAWPIAISFVALVYRGQISQLLKRIRRAKYGNAEVDFSDELDKIEAQASGLPSKSDADAGETASEVSELATRKTADDEQASDYDPESHQISEGQDRFIEIAKVSPSAAVLDAWRDVELELERSFKRSGLPREKKRIAPLQRGMKLYGMGVIHAHTIDMIKHLQSLRNEAAHTQEISVTDAYRFKALANKAINLLQYDLAR